VPLGSFHVAIDYDTNAATVVRALAAANGMQAVNANIPGTIEVAGVAPAGFASGLLTTIALRNRSRSEAVAFKLTLIELSTTAGDDVRRTALISGFPAGDPALGGVGPARRMADSARRLEAQASASAAAAPPEAPPTANKKTLIWIAPAPRVDSLAPSGARLAGDAVVEVVVHGGGFTFSGNVVVFGSTEIGPVPSANGTTLRFTVPTTLPSHGEVPPMRVSPGEFPVRIRNGNGESNAMTFTVRG
jgi:guanyl-specific ribonuclease Sa